MAVKTRERHVEAEAAAPLQVMQNKPPAISDGEAFANMLERIVRDPSIDLDRLDRVQAMRKSVLADEAQRSWNEAMSLAQAEFPVIEQRGKIIVKDRATGNIIQETSYSLWEDVWEALKGPMTSHGLSLRFQSTESPDKATVIAIVGHRLGHSESSGPVTVLNDKTGSKNDAQARGSALTYAKKYAAGLILNFVSRDGTDDDATRTGEKPKIDEKQLVELNTLVAKSGVRIDQFLERYGINDIPDLPAEQFKQAVDDLNDFIERKKKAQAEAEAKKKSE